MASFLQILLRMSNYIPPAQSALPSSKQSSSGGIIAARIIGVLGVLVGIAAIVMINTDQINHAEIGTAKTVAKWGLGLGLAWLFIIPAILKSQRT